MKSASSVADINLKTEETNKVEKYLDDLSETTTEPIERQEGSKTIAQGLNVPTMYIPTELIFTLRPGITIRCIAE